MKNTPLGVPAYADLVRSVAEGLDLARVDDALAHAVPLYELHGPDREDRRAAEALESVTFAHEAQDTESPYPRTDGFFAVTAG